MMHQLSMAQSSRELIRSDVQMLRSARMPSERPFQKACQQRQRAGARAPQQMMCTASAATTSASLHTLPDGTELEVIRVEASGGQGGTARPPLLFLHGSGHAAWCWQERFQPFFAERGYESYAVSFRGQGGGSVPEGAKPGSLASNAADVAHFLAALPAGTQPVAVSHSFGGLVLQKYVELQDARGWPELGGTAYLASAPPSGNQALVKRIMAAMPLKSIRITWGFITKSYLRSTPAAKDLFFSEDIAEDDMARFGELFKGNPGSGVGLIDTRKLLDELPIVFPPPERRPASYVAGGDADCIVDVPAVEELARELGVAPVIHRNAAHDLMLDTRWREAAESLQGWLASL